MSAASVHAFLAKGKPGKRGLLRPVFDEVYKQFKKWRRRGQYADLSDLYVEYCYRADEI